MSTDCGHTIHFKAASCLFKVYSVDLDWNTEEDCAKKKKKKKEYCTIRWFELLLRSKIL